MLRSLLVMALIAGAAGCPADDDYMRRHGGGPPGSGTGGDAGAPDASDGGAGALRSKVCVVVDLRQPTSCSASNNVGVVVRELGSQTQVTSVAGGFFDLALAAQDVAILEVGTGSPALVPSIVAIDVRNPPATVPVPSAAEYTALVQRLGVATPNGSGDVVLFFLDPSKRPLPGVTVEMADGGAFPPFYDVTGASQWIEGAPTGPFGASLLFGVPAGTTSITAATDVENLSLGGIRVVDDHVTFVTSQPTL